MAGDGGAELLPSDSSTLIDTLRKELAGAATTVRVSANLSRPTAEKLLQLLEFERRDGAIVLQARREYSPNDAARSLNISRQTVMAMLRDGKFEKARRVGSHWRIPAEDIRRTMEQAIQFHRDAAAEATRRSAAFATAADQIDDEMMSTHVAARPISADTSRLRGLLAARGGEIADVLAGAGVERALVFGSVARGDAGPSSDIDIFVEFAPRKASKILLETGGLMVRLTRLLGVQVDIMDAVLAEPNVLTTARKDMIPLESITS